MTAGWYGESGYGQGGRDDVRGRSLTERPHALEAADMVSQVPSAPEELILQARALTKVYESARGQASVQALAGIDLDIHRGEFVSVMGPSGSGKTTLLNVLAGLDLPTSGALWLGGQNMAALRPDHQALFRRRNLGFVFQDFNLLDALTLGENVALPLLLDSGAGKQARSRVAEVMAYLGLSEYLNRYPYEVSGGQQQRAAVARALVHQPRLLLADEPTGNLDSASARSLLQLFQRLNAERDATILMVTHDPFSASYSGSVVFIKDGRVFGRLERSGSQRAFFDAILQTLAALEGSHELA